MSMQGDPRQGDPADPRWRTGESGRASGASPYPPAPPPPSTAARFFGGNPTAVLLRLVLLSVVVGVIFAVLGFDPRDLVRALEDIVRSLVWNSADLVRALVRYFLLGAAIVFPIWLVLRLLKITTRR